MRSASLVKQQGKKGMSLRARLLLSLGVVALLVLVASGVATYSLLRSFLFGRVNQQLQQSHIAVERLLEGGGAPGGPGAPNGPGPAGQQPSCFLLQGAAQGTFVEVRTSSGTTVCPVGQFGETASSPKLPARITGYSAANNPHGEPTVYFNTGSASPGGPRFRVRASEIGPDTTLILALPLSDTYSTLEQLLLIELAVAAGALALSGVVGWWLVRVGLRPLAAIERTAAIVAQGELGHRVPGASNRTEVGRLAGVLNVMLGRIEGAFAARDATEGRLRASEARMRRFVSDASHELRTPLAAVSAYAELFDRGASQRPEDLERVMSGIRSETGRMGHLVDDLLLLARMDEGRPLEKEPVELVALAAEAVDAARAVGSDWPVQLKASEPVEVTGDPARLRQVVDNLLSNTRDHTPPGTDVTVSVSRDAADAVIEVADNGPGIDPELADRLFERFYRSDASRSRASGGSGLGLSIVSAIVAGHGGSVTARRRAEGGSVFTVRIPAAS
jgi:two-component system OmpR family sensor kinase